MNRFVSVLFVVCSGLALAGALAGAQGDVATIGVDDIRPGMKGYGLTVFRGTQPEKFDVEVIDVLHNFRPDQDLILVKTPHPILNNALVVGGMSGSPIYFNGKLAGAYAYGWPFGRDPVAGVTPIKNMMREMYRPVRGDSFPGAHPLGPAKNARRKKSKKRAALKSTNSPSFAGLAPTGKLGEANALAGIQALAKKRIASRGENAIRPASTPVMLGGFSQEVAELLGKQLEPFGLVALQAGGSSNKPSKNNGTFVNGGAVGVQLIQGDVSATGVGTVTHVGRNNRVIGFGHPMMNAGEIGLPTATAKVIHILASVARSFKIAEADTSVGTLIHDRQSAIVLDTKLEAATVPVKIRIHGVEGAPRTEWNVKVAGHRVLTPMLMFGALTNALKATASDATHVMFEAKTKVSVNGHRTISHVDRGAMAGGAADALGLSRLRMFSVVEAAYGNPFEESRINSVEIDLSLRFARDAIQVLGATVVSEEVDPGSTVQVRVQLKQFGRPEFSKTIPVRVPTHAAGESVSIEIAAGNRIRFASPQPENLEDLLKASELGLPASELVASLKMPHSGLQFKGHVVKSLPSSAINSLQLVTGDGPASPFATYERKRLRLKQVVVGGAVIKLRVREVARDQ